MGYYETCSSEGNSVANWFGNWASVKRSVEVGTPIRITHRNNVRNETSNLIIACSNIRGFLKPQGNVIVVLRALLACELQVVLLITFETKASTWLRSENTGPTKVTLSRNLKI